MLQHSKILTNDLYDPDTGQQLFKPMVGRAPMHGRAAAKDVSSSLYKAAMVSNYKKMTKIVESEVKRH